MALHTQTPLSTPYATTLCHILFDIFEIMMMMMINTTVNESINGIIDLNHHLSSSPPSLRRHIINRANVF
jgi:hypothetical protein